MSAGELAINFGSLTNAAALYQNVIENNVATCPGVVAAIYALTLPASGTVEDGAYSVPEPSPLNWGFETTADSAYTVSVSVDAVDCGFFTVEQIAGIVSVDLTNCTATWPALVSGITPNGNNVFFSINGFGNPWKAEFSVPSAVLAIEPEWVSCAVPACALPGTSYCIINPPIAVSNYTFTSTPGAIIK